MEQGRVHCEGGTKFFEDFKAGSGSPFFGEDIKVGTDFVPRQVEGV